jgi:cell division protein FtsI (penicillin-binding protein 3)
MKNLKFTEDNSNNMQSKSLIKPINVQKVNNSSLNQMPDLVNCRVKDAINALTRLGIKYKIKGTGMIISQSIVPGKKLKGNEMCLLECSEVYIKGVSLY